MRYIEEILQPGEKLIYSTTIHWLVYLPGLIMWAVAIGIFAAGFNSSAKPLWTLVALACALLAAASTFHAWFRRWTTEIDVTDRRVVYKRGFIRRHTIEINMDKVESVDVDQSLFGRLFDYGDIVIRGTGAGIEPLRGIDSPLAFRNAVTAR